MGITDELREWAHGFTEPCKRNEQQLLAIADRIDAAHEEAIASVMNDALYHANDKDMAELGWVRLPKDADGEYVHEHDKVDWRDHSGTWHKNALVVAVCSDGCYVMDGMVFHVHASDIRHHKHPTVEDVLAELLCEYDRDDFELTELIERYAAKLQLRGDE